ncbi:MAG TPA: hypothetical protein DCY71_01390, partial [Clostridiaceae bacterium]|nr:hypothetical protein [Clostridiaceae bacterium]
MDQNNGKVQFTNFFSNNSKQISQLKETLEQDVQAMKEYQQQIQISIPSQEAWANSSSKMSEAAKKFVGANKEVGESEEKSNAAIGQFVAQQSGEIDKLGSSVGGKIGGIASKFKSFGSNLLSGIANGGMWAAIGIGIELLGKAIDNEVNKDKNAAEAADKLTDSYKKQQSTFTGNISTLNSLKSEYDELSKGVDSTGKNVNLSTNDFNKYHSIANQIAQLSPSLVSGWDNEGNAILSKNNALEASIKLQQQSIEQSKERQTIGKDGDNTWNGDWAGYRNAAYLSANPLNNRSENTPLYEDLMGAAGADDSHVKNAENLTKILKNAGVNVSDIANKNVLDLSVEKALVQKRQEITAELVKQNNLTDKQKTEVKSIFDNLSNAASDQEEYVSKMVSFADTWASTSSNQSWYKGINDNGFLTQFNGAITNYLNENPNVSIDTMKTKVTDLGNTFNQLKSQIPIKEFNTLSEDIANKTVTSQEEKNANASVQSLRKLANQYRSTDPIISSFIGLVADGYAQNVQSAEQAIKSNQSFAGSLNSIKDAAQAADSALSNSQQNYKDYAKGLNDLIKLQQGTGTGSSIDPDEYAEVVKSIPDLDLSKAVEYHNGDMQFNVEELQKATKAYTDQQEAINNVNIASEQLAYDSNASQINSYNQELKTNTSLNSKQKQSLEDKISSLKDEQTTIQGNLQQYQILNSALEETTSNYTAWQNAQKARDSGDMYKDIASAKEQLTNGLHTGDIGSQKFKASVDLLIPDTFEPKDKQRVKNYLSQLNRYITTDEKGNVNDTGLGNFMSDMVTKGFAKKDNDGQYKLIGKHAMSEIAKGMEITPDMAKSIFGKLEDKGMKFNFKDEDPTKVLSEDFKNINQEIQDINNNDIIDPKVKTDELTKAYSALYNLNHLKEKTSSNTDNIKIKATVEVDDQINAAKKKVADLKEQVKNSSGTAKITANTKLGNAQKELSQLESTKNSLDKPTTAEVKVQIDQNNNKIDKLKTDLQTLQKNPKDKSVVQKLMVGYSITDDPKKSDAKEVQDYIQKQIASIQKETKDLQIDFPEVNTKSVAQATAEVKKQYSVEKAAIEGHPLQVTASNNDAMGKINQVVKTKIPDKHFNITASIGSTISLPTIKLGKANGTAHANGTANLNGTAYADGNWGTTVGGKTLVGELGQEIVVDPANGKWHTVGENGAEFVDIPRGAIVFNHIQSKDILENGYVTSRGSIVNALANGTAHVQGDSLASGNAMVTGGGYLPSSNPAVSGYYEGDNGTPSTKENTKAIKENTSAKKENAKAKKDSSDATKEENKALDDYTKKLEHEKNMGEYDSIQGK